MKITQAWENRKEVIESCRAVYACEDEFKRLTRARSQITFEEVLLNNFYWCVKKGVLEEWLPKELSHVKRLSCNGCTGLASIPVMPKLERLTAINARD